MPKRYDINKEQLAELEQARKENKNKTIEKRLKALVLHAQGESRTSIAEKTGFSQTYISRLVSKYCNHGIETIIENHYHGNRRNLSFAEEQALLEPFQKAAEEGKLIDIDEIKKAYGKAVGRSFEDDRKQIYRVLKRHGWRKVMPRSKHPNKASEEVIEASKKLTISSETRWQILPREVSD